jgi:hypothetical protein
MAVAAVTMVAAGAALFSAGAAWSAPTPTRHLDLVFNDAADQVEFTIPTPPCVRQVTDCQWMLYVNMPLLPGQPRVGFTVGTSGTLVVPYPQFCGVIQADAIRGPAPWKWRAGIRETISNCGDSSTTTTTTDPTTTTSTSTSTTTTSTSTTSTTVQGGQAAATTTTTGGGAAGSSALPFTGTNGGSSGGTSSGSAAHAAAAQLPFTGIDLRPLVILGIVLMILGGLLLSTVESRRRMLRRASAIGLDVKDGARRTSSWFLGL